MLIYLFFYNQASTLKNIILHPPYRPPHLFFGNELMLFDTGSYITWISDLTCEDCPMKLRTCSNGNSSFKEVRYGIGQIRGQVQELLIGDNIVKGICTTFAKNIQSFGGHGLLAVSPSIQNNVIAQLCRKQNMTMAFSIYFGHNYNVLTLGGMNSAWLDKQAALTELNLLSPTSWAVYLKSLSFDSVGFNSNFSAVFDTGSTHLVLPRSLFFQLISFLENQEVGCKEDNLEIVCPFGSSLPRIGLRFSETQQAYLSGKDYSLTRGGQTVLLVTYFKEDSNTIVLGNPFLSKYYTMFNMENKTVSLSMTDEGKRQEDRDRGKKVFLGLCGVIVGVGLVMKNWLMVL